MKSHQCKQIFELERHSLAAQIHPNTTLHKLKSYVYICAPNSTTFFLLIFMFSNSIKNSLSEYPMIYISFSRCSLVLSVRAVSPLSFYYASPLWRHFSRHRASPDRGAFCNNVFIEPCICGCGREFIAFL
jgi:hypothetical protein